MSEIIRKLRTGGVRPAFDEQSEPLMPKPYMNMLDDLFLRDNQQYFFEPLPNAQPESPPTPDNPYYKQWLKDQAIPQGQRIA